jgi:hypothetical protein
MSETTRIPRLVKASSLSATYAAGIYVTASDAEAVELARDAYRDSQLGRTMKDVGAFRFYVAGRGKEAYADAV